MSTNEWKLIKRVLLLVFIAALFPLGAFVYRFLLDTPLLVSAGPTVIPALYTLVPGAETAVPVPTPTNTPMVLVVPNGWTELAVPEQHLAIAVPPRWQQLPVNQQELDASLEVIRKSNPELAAALGARGEELLASGVKLWAFDFDAASLESKFATNLTITRQMLANPVSFDTYVTVNVSQIEQLSSLQGPVTHVRITINNVPAEKVRYKISFQGEDGSSGTSAITQYLIMSRSSAFVLTYATLADELERYAAEFDQSAETFRVLGP
ncbi:MAG: hypothetical protein ACM3JD_10770 [Rudaea sp.]